MQHSHQSQLCYKVIDIDWKVLSHEAGRSTISPLKNENAGHLYITR